MAYHHLPLPYRHRHLPLSPPPQLQPHPPPPPPQHIPDLSTRSLFPTCHRLFPTTCHHHMSTMKSQPWPPKLPTFLTIISSSSQLLMARKIPSLTQQMQTNLRGQRTLMTDQVWLASYHLTGTAQLWYYMLERDQGQTTWDRFKELCHLRFELTLRTNPLGELAVQLQTTVEYQERFMALLCHEPCKDERHTTPTTPTTTAARAAPKPASRPLPRLLHLPPCPPPEHRLPQSCRSSGSLQLRWRSAASRG